MSFSRITINSSLKSLIYLDCRVTLSVMAFNLVSNFTYMVSCTLFIFSVMSTVVFSSCFLKNVSKLLADSGHLSCLLHDFVLLSFQSSLFFFCK